MLHTWNTVGDLLWNLFIFMKLFSFSKNPFIGTKFFHFHEIYSLESFKNLCAEYLHIAPLYKRVGWQNPLRGRLQTTLTSVWLFLTTYSPPFTFSTLWTLTKIDIFWLPWEFLKLHTFRGFMDKTDRNSAKEFCHPPGAVCNVLSISKKFLVF